MTKLRALLLTLAVTLGLAGAAVPATTAQAAICYSLSFRVWSDSDRYIRVVNASGGYRSIHPGTSASGTWRKFRVERYHDIGLIGEGYNRNYGGSSSTAIWYNIPGVGCERGQSYGAGQYHW